MEQNKVEIFENEDFGCVRTVTANNEPFFCLTDICKALEISQPSKVKDRLKQKGVRTIPTLTSGGTQGLLYINESNLYKTVFQSRKKSAEQFTDWITEEVIPSIRKTGSFNVGQPTPVDRTQLFATAVLEAHKMIEEQNVLIEKQTTVIEELKPKAEFHDVVNDTEEKITIGCFSGILHKEHGVEVSAAKLFDFFRQKKFICSMGNLRNKPSQAMLDKGYMNFNEFSRKVYKPRLRRHEMELTFTPLITGKGQIYFTKRIIKACKQGEL